MGGMTTTPFEPTAPDLKGREGKAAILAVMAGVAIHLAWGIVDTLATMSGFPYDIPATPQLGSWAKLAGFVLGGLAVSAIARTYWHQRALAAQNVYNAVAPQMRLPAQEATRNVMRVHDRTRMVPVDVTVAHTDVDAAQRAAKNTALREAFARATGAAAADVVVTVVGGRRNAGVRLRAPHPDTGSAHCARRRRAAHPRPASPTRPPVPRAPRALHLIERIGKPSAGSCGPTRSRTPGRETYPEDGYPHDGVDDYLPRPVRSIAEQLAEAPLHVPADRPCRADEWQSASSASLPARVHLPHRPPRQAVPLAAPEENPNLQEGVIVGRIEYGGALAHPAHGWLSHPRRRPSGREGVRAVGHHLRAAADDR